jgi:hypothetical protein
MGALTSAGERGWGRGGGGHVALQMRGGPEGGGGGGWVRWACDEQLMQAAVRCEVARACVCAGGLHEGAIVRCGIRCP